MATKKKRRDAKGVPRPSWDSRRKADYLSRQFDRVCTGEITMEDYNMIREEVKKL